MATIDFSAEYSVFGEEVLSTAYGSVEPELLALSVDELESVNIDILPAVNTAAGITPEVKKFRGRIVEELPRFDITRFDKLPRYAMAAAYAHTVHLAATEPQDRLNPLFQESVALCDLLGSDLRTLSNRNLINPEVLKGLKGTNGYKNTQSDLQMLVNIFRTNWSNVVGKCGTTEAELARGEKLVSWLIQAVGLKEQGPAEKARTADLRMRAFTLFVRAYDDARRAIAYLLWHEGDVDSVIPSLYAGRTRKKETTNSDREGAPNGAGPSDAVLARATSNGAGPKGANGSSNAAEVRGMSNGALGDDLSTGTDDGGPFAS